MKILLISDTHDAVQNMRSIFTQVQDMGISALLHAGDLVHPDTLSLLTTLNVPVYYAIGNNEEGYEEELTTLCHTYGITASLSVVECVLDGKKIAMTHYPEAARMLGHSGKYDLVVYGHTHFSKKEQLGNTLLVNPGNVIGTREEAKYGIYDTTSHIVELYPVRKKSYHFD